ncbi:hypothetical protein RI367_002910 [Sorochytrium milnesiophthora]
MPSESYWDWLPTELQLLVLSFSDITQAVRVRSTAALRQLGTRVLLDLCVPYLFCILVRGKCDEGWVSRGDIRGWSVGADVLQLQIDDSIMPDIKQELDESKDWHYARNNCCTLFSIVARLPDSKPKRLQLLERLWMHAPSAWASFVGDLAVCGHVDLLETWGILYDVVMNHKWHTKPQELWPFDDEPAVVDRNISISSLSLAFARRPGGSRALAWLARSTLLKHDRIITWAVDQCSVGLLQWWQDNMNADGDVQLGNDLLRNSQCWHGCLEDLRWLQQQRPDDPCSPAALDQALWRRDIAMATFLFDWN